MVYMGGRKGRAGFQRIDFLQFFEEFEGGTASEMGAASLLESSGDFNDGGIGAAPPNQFPGVICPPAGVVQNQEFFFRPER